MENNNKVPVKLTKGFVFPGYAAWVPFRRRIIYSKKYQPTRRLVAHELVHVVQHEKYGLMFYPRYFLGWIFSGFNYWNIPMEKEARSGEQDHFYISWAEEVMRKSGLI